MKYEDKFDALVKIIKDFHNYLSDKIDYRNKIHKNCLHGANILHTESGSTNINLKTRKGIASGWIESYHNGTPYDYKEKEMTNEEVIKQLESHIKYLQNLAIEKAKSDIVQETAVKRLRELGLYI